MGLCKNDRQHQVWARGAAGDRAPGTDQAPQHELTTYAQVRHGQADCSLLATEGWVDSVNKLRSSSVRPGEYVTYVNDFPHLHWRVSETQENKAKIDIW